MNVFTQLNKVLNHPLNKNRKITTLGKIIWWKTNQLFFKIPAIIKMTDGAKLVCYPQNSYGSFVVYTNLPEYDELNFINNIISNGDIFIDVGANIGSESVLAASKGKDVKVFAFEPTKSLIPLLAENIAVNDFSSRIKIIQKAVSNNNGKLKFILEKESEVNHIATKKNEGKNVEEVECETLDTFAKNKKITKINFLKVDVEGAEPLVFEGAKKLIDDGKIDIILFELNKNVEDFGYTSRDIISSLKINNFFVFQFNQRGKLVLVKSNIKVVKTMNLVAVRKDKFVIRKIINHLFFE